MAGFGPVGTTPVASIGSGPSGTIFIPAPGYLYLEATGEGGIGGYADLSGTSPINVYATARESLQSDIASLNSYTVSREALASYDASLFTYTFAREVLMSGSTGGIIRASVSIIW